MNRQELFDLHAKLSAKALEIMKAKNADYAGKGDGSPFGNFERSEVLGIPRELGLMLRVMDKFCRIKTFIESGTLAVKGEPVDDAILDIINYMVLLMGMVEEKRGPRDTYTYRVSQAGLPDSAIVPGRVTWLVGQQDLRTEWDLDESTREKS